MHTQISVIIIIHENIPKDKDENTTFYLGRLSFNEHLHRNNETKVTIPKRIPLYLFIYYIRDTNSMKKFDINVFI
jgi:hypothetical protein